jgi:proline dehydrogenase
MLKTRLSDAVRPTAHRISKFLSGAYVAGPELRDAVRAVDRFGRNGHAATIGYFNSDGESPRAIAALNMGALEAIADGRRNGYVSIKAPALNFDHTLVREMARVSQRTGVGLHFDSHEIDTADSTFTLIETAVRDSRHVGCTLPSRWTRSLHDADRAGSLGMRVRVVKGQWADPAQPDVDVGKSYLALVDRLAGRVRAVGVATHDPVLARAAMRRLRRAGTPCELELLFGLPMRGALAVAREESVPVCVYVPFGNGWMPYAMSQLRRNPGIALWMMKDAMAAAALMARV